MSRFGDMALAAAAFADACRRGLGQVVELSNGGGLRFRGRGP